jgi:hypothetical protein
VCGGWLWLPLLFPLGMDSTLTPRANQMRAERPERNASALRTEAHEAIGIVHVPEAQTERGTGSPWRAVAARSPPPVAGVGNVTSCATMRAVSACRLAVIRRGGAVVYGSTEG